MSWQEETERRALADKARLAKLIGERDTLEGEIRKLTDRVHSWDLILRTERAKSSKRPGKRVEGAAETPAAEPAQGLGLRAAIRGVLSTVSGGMKPREVTLRLKATGFRPSGKGDLGLRVNGELWRMHRNGLLRKTRGGYMLPKESGEPTP